MYEVERAKQVMREIRTYVMGWICWELVNADGLILEDIEPRRVKQWATLAERMVSTMEAWP